MSDLAGLVGKQFFRLGDTGQVVTAIQLRLRELGYGLKGTGYFGAATLTAVKTFQARAGVIPDGVAGEKTAKALDAAVVRSGTLAVVHAPGLAPVAMTEVSRPLWLEAGIALIGTREVPGTASNKVIIDWAKGEGGDIAKEYTHDSIPFCALFENHILTKAGLEGTETLWALDFNADRMEKRIGRRWPGMRIAGPAVGAIAPMLRNGGGHVITVVGKDQHGNVMGLGSNQSDTTSIIPFPVVRLNEGFWWPESVPIPTRIGFSQLPLVRSDGRLSTAEA